VTSLILTEFDIIKTMEFLLLIGFVLFIYFISRRKTSSTTPDSNVNKLLNLIKINKEKHACKCYMEGLTPGEQRVADILAMKLDFKDYFLFNNIIIKSKNNTSTQIDHIVVSKFGVFVIESKDLSGWIFGSNNSSTWTQSLPGAIKYKFQNPLRQNYGHLMALKELMPFVKDNFYNVVVFTGNAEIKTERMENVLYLSELIEFIKKHNQVKLNENEVQFAIGKLSYACQTINITVGEHVANIYANKNINTINPNPQYSFNTYYNNPAKKAYLLK